MKKALVAYFSQGGTTAKIAKEISKGLHDKGYEADFHKITDHPSPDINQYDLIGVGSPVYICRPPFNVMRYVKNLPDLNGRPFFVFMLHGTHPGTAGNILRKAMERKGGREVGYSRFKGADFFVGYIQKGVLFSPDNPATNELERARVFGQESANFASCDGYIKPPKDPLPPAVYSFERMLTMRFMTNYIYSYFFKADTEKCSSCGLCVKICPQNNIGLNQDGMPRWGRKCIFCGYCELRCPEDAITTPVDWTVFAPLILYNIHHSKNINPIEYVPVMHRKGKTKRI
jgi:flavodoxin/NAD-dependent dihydropyrimidine dehydrogenase PreA subunit